ncbi:unnamed protein product [Callosobruchus maculatus]|uniref:Uncharacterized protein n=1 Tax=Callosobruchus maculatus TaxID=64391 RepID=A0A653DEK0_CALMS|nr:unnamed protein product [Callosobruchus maculatus]
MLAESDFGPSTVAILVTRSCVRSSSIGIRSPTPIVAFRRNYVTHFVCHWWIPWPHLLTLKDLLFHQFRA